MILSQLLSLTTALGVPQIFSLEESIELAPDSPYGELEAVDLAPIQSPHGYVGLCFSLTKPVDRGRCYSEKSTWIMISRWE